jgi:hypothetical protein
MRIDAVGALSHLLLNDHCASRHSVLSGLTLCGSFGGRVVTSTAMQSCWLNSDCLLGRYYEIPERLFVNHDVLRSDGIPN